MSPQSTGESAKKTESSFPRSAICASRWKWATSRWANGSLSGSRQDASWWPVLIRNALRTMCRGGAWVMRLPCSRGSLVGWVVSAAKPGRRTPRASSSSRRRCPKSLDDGSRSSASWTRRSRAIRPCDRTTTRSASVIASSTSWVTSSTAGRWTLRRLRSSPCIFSRVRASSAPNGSSARSSSGSRTRDRASATRCCSPPESWCGQSVSRPSSPTSARASLPRARAALRWPRVTLVIRFAHGSSRESWKTTDTLPGTRIRPLPDTAASRPASARSSVLLPQPLGPSRATNSPRSISRSTPLSTPLGP